MTWHRGGETKHLATTPDALLIPQAAIIRQSRIKPINYIGSTLLSMGWILH